MTLKSSFSWKEHLLASPAVAVAVFCVGLLGCTGLGVALVTTLIAKGGATVDVTGVSSQLIKSDRVKWSFNVKSTSRDRSAGAKSQQQQLEKALLFLRSNEIPDDDVFVKVLYVNPNIQRNPESGQETLTGWSFSQEIVVVSDEVDKVAEVSRRSSDLISSGVDARFKMPEYTFSGISDKRVELLKGATSNAKERAEAIASTGNLSLGRMTNVGTAVFQVTTPGSSSAGGGGVYDTGTIDKEISAVMSVSFRLK
jgi:hypothetical protein